MCIVTLLELVQVQRILAHSPTDQIEEGGLARERRRTLPGRAFGNDGVDGVDGGGDVLPGATEPDALAARDDKKTDASERAVGRGADADARAMDDSFLADGMEMDDEMY